MMNLATNYAIDAVLGYFAAGQVAKNSDIVDMEGWDGVTFIAIFGTILENGTLNVQVQHDTDPAGGTMAAVAGTGAYTVTAADALKTQSCIIVDVHRPRKRYVRATLTPAVANAVICGVVAIRYCGRKSPVTQAANVLKTTVLAEPASA